MEKLLKHGFENACRLKTCARRLLRPPRNVWLSPRGVGGAFDWFVAHVRSGKSECSGVVLVGVWSERIARRVLRLSYQTETRGRKGIARNNTHIDPASIADDLVEPPILAIPG